MQVDGSESADGAEGLWGGLGFGVILHHLGFPEHGTLLGAGCKVVQDSLHTQQTAGIEGMDYRDYKSRV